MRALRQTGGAVRVRYDCAVRQPYSSRHPPASPGARSHARHRRPDRPAFPPRHPESRVVVADPHRWAILYLGSAKAAQLAPDREVVVLNRKGEPEPNQDALLRDIEGVVLLDGNWSQAKALWWRNAWMLKCRRVILGPRRPSRYGRLRREPRRDSLATIEAAAMLVSRLENRPEIEAALTASFEKMLAGSQAP